MAKSSPEEPPHAKQTDFREKYYLPFNGFLAIRFPFADEPKPRPAAATVIGDIAGDLIQTAGLRCNNDRRRNRKPIRERSHQNRRLEFHPRFPADPVRGLSDSDVFQVRESCENSDSTRVLTGANSRSPAGSFGRMRSLSRLSSRCSAHDSISKFNDLRPRRAAPSSSRCARTSFPLKELLDTGRLLPGRKAPENMRAISERVTTIANRNFRIFWTGSEKERG